jgi:hypothetical protein
MAQHPELTGSKDFIAHKYDLHWLIKAPPARRRTGSPRAAAKERDPQARSRSRPAGCAPCRSDPAVGDRAANLDVGR